MNIIQKIIANPRTCAKCGIKETPRNVIIEYCTINGRQFICDDCLCLLPDDYFVDCAVIKKYEVMPELERVEKAYDQLKKIFSEKSTQLRDLEQKKGGN